MKKLICQTCGGSLTQNNQYYECENCGCRYLIGKDEQGDSFFYQPVEKKQISSGQIAAKSATIKVNSVSVKQFYVNTTTVNNENKKQLIEEHEAIAVIPIFLKNREWEKARQRIDEVLANNPGNAEALLYSLIVARKASDINSFMQRIDGFLENELETMDKILSLSTPSYAKKIIDAFLNNKHNNDEVYQAVLSITLPYAKNTQINSESEFDAIIKKAFNEAISHTYQNSFEYLLSNALNSTDVDAYILYLQRFAQAVSAPRAIKYYKMILDVDPGNVKVRRDIVNADIMSNVDEKKIISDVEGLINYSNPSDVNIEIERIFNSVLLQEKTTPNIASFVWSLMGYHSQSPEAFKTQILKFSHILLKSSLWEQTTKFLTLLLSFDKENATAQWHLCLAENKIQNDVNLVFSKKNIIDSPYFDKALAAFRREGNNEKVNQLMKCSKKQKQGKLLVKTGIIAIVAVIICVISIVSVTLVVRALRHSSDMDATIDFSSKGDRWIYGKCELKIKTKATITVKKMHASINFYDDNGLIASSDFELKTDFLSEQETELNLLFDDYTKNNLSKRHYEAVRITLVLENMVFEDKFVKLITDKKEITLKEITKSESIFTKEAEEKKAEEERLKEQQKKEEAERIEKENSEKYSSAIELLESGAYEQAKEIFDSLDQYKDSREKSAFCSDQINEKKYSGAQERNKAGKYKEAYDLFLEIKEYKDSEVLAKKIREASYDRAIDFAEAGDYHKALLELQSFEFSDDELLLACQEVEKGNYKPIFGMGYTKFQVGIKIIPEEALGDLFRYNSSIKEISIPNTVEIIETNAFANCTGLENVTIPEGVKEIRYGAFCGCRNLKSFTLPKSLKRLEDNVFSACDSLGTLKYNGTSTEWDNLSKGVNWSYNSNLKKIKCSNATYDRLYSRWE